MRQLTIERAATIILFALLFALAARIPTDSDTWWHLRSGEYILSNGVIHTDPFSFTKAGEPWIDHSWGSQIILYEIWQVAGNFGLSIYVAALATAGMVMIYLMSPGSVYLRAFTLVIGAATAAVFWSPRPQMISFFLSTVILYLLYLNKRQKIDRLWLIPVIMAVWGNLHAGFSIGFIFLAGSIAGEILGHIFTPNADNLAPWSGIRKLVIVTLVSVAALVINPYGLQMLAVPFQTLSIGALQNFIQEWNSPNFHERQTWPFIVLLLGLLGAVGGSRKRLDWADFVLASGTAFMGLSGRAQYCRVCCRCHPYPDRPSGLPAHRTRLGNQAGAPGNTPHGTYECASCRGHCMCCAAQGFAGIGSKNRAGRPGRIPPCESNPVPCG